MTMNGAIVEEIYMHLAQLDSVRDLSKPRKGLVNEKKNDSPARAKFTKDNFKKPA